MEGMQPSSNTEHNLVNALASHLDYIQDALGNSHLSFEEYYDAFDNPHVRVWIFNENSKYDDRLYTYSDGWAILFDSNGYSTN